VSRYSPPYLEIKFPLTYLSTWQGSSTYYDLKYGDTAFESTQGAVDGYGSLIVPSSSSQASLRVVLRFSYYNPHSSSSASIDNSFYWFTKSLYWASISADDTLKPRNGGYAEPIVNSVSAPVSSGNALHLDLDALSNAITSLRYSLKQDGPVQISLMDVLGRNVRTQTARAISGQNETSLDTHSLPAGTYFVHVAAEGATQTQKFIISR